MFYYFFHCSIFFWVFGGDTTGFEGTEEYFTGISKNIPDLVADYGAHLYLSNIAVDRGEMMEQIRTK